MTKLMCPTFTELKAYWRNRKRTWFNRKDISNSPYRTKVIDPEIIFGPGTGYEEFFLIGDAWVSDDKLPIILIIGCNDWKYGFVVEYLRQYRVAFVPRKMTGIRLCYKIRRLKIQPEKVAVWGYNEDLVTRNYLKIKYSTVTRIEDAFIRSSKLGAEHTVPYSLIFDDHGLYFNSQSNSKLIQIIKETETELPREALEQVEALRKLLISKRVVKYNPPVLNCVKDKSPRKKSVF